MEETLGRDYLASYMSSSVYEKEELRGDMTLHNLYIHTIVMKEMKISRMR